MPPPSESENDSAPESGAGANAALAGWNARGSELRTAGEPVRAAQAFEAALDLAAHAVAVADSDAARRHAAATLAAVANNLGTAHRDAGRAAAAEAAFLLALEADAELAAPLFNLHALYFDDRDMGASRSCLEALVERHPEHALGRFFLGVLAERAGETERAEALFSGLEEDGLDFMLESRDFAKPHLDAGARLFADTFATLNFGLRAARPDGAVLELGVRGGTTLRHLAARVAGPVHGFDSFEGLPEAWGGQPIGLYSTGGRLPEVPDNALLHVGWFADTLPPFVAALREPIRFVNVDCDLGVSTRSAFDALAAHVVPGTVLVFDEYFANPGWQEEEHRALVDAARDHGFAYEHLGFSYFSRQVVVRVTAVRNKG